ncbi:hypothetical protein O9G_003919 [Rozella allomycis CSF55]|uniref:Transmembrane protein n=1 Tax=Rozella allomycis (strain CSF55) TaxID=988480 RepID=A0A075AT03_ROZAC|nr:hypothetical protein O9G_003919 [Rozella allomycis CSF55]|eukprot:EPZ33416.1 hypothetical protein O9G_003919 [Rozella allomycis CSF55]
MRTIILSLLLVVAIVASLFSNIKSICYQKLEPLLKWLLPQKYNTSNNNKPLKSILVKEKKEGREPKRVRFNDINEILEYEVDPDHGRPLISLKAHQEECKREKLAKKLKEIRMLFLESLNNELSDEKLEMKKDNKGALTSEEGEKSKQDHDDHDFNSIILLGTLTVAGILVVGGSLLFIKRRSVDDSRV